MSRVPDSIHRLSVIGVGLLGGSVALATRAANERIHIVGVGRRMESLRRALESGAVDEITMDAAEGVASADLVVLATPLGSYESHLRAIAPALKPQTIVTDVGSTKDRVVAQAQKIIGRRARFVGSHPMAGGERKGVDFARADLFVNRICIVTPTRATDPEALETVEAFWRTLGAVTVRLSPSRHDAAVARVSHLPHLLASLVVTAQRQGSLELAGPGFLDFTRIASGDPEMWREILLYNAPAVLDCIADSQKQLDRLRKIISRSDAVALERYLAQAKTRRDELFARRLKMEE